MAYGGPALLQRTLQCLHPFHSAEYHHTAAVIRGTGATQEAPGTAVQTEKPVGWQGSGFRHLQ